MDPRQLEALFQFQRFLEIVSNPDEMKAFLKETKETVEEHKLVLGLISTKEMADAYAKKVQAEADALRDTSAKEREKHLENMKMESVNITNIKTQNQKMSAALSEREQKVSLREKEAEDILVKAKQELSAIKQQQQDLDQRERDLSTKETALEEKAKKLKQLLG